MSAHYTKPTWTNDEGTSINAERLQAISNALYDLVNSEDAKAISDISFDSTGRTMTITFVDGNIKTVPNAMAGPEGPKGNGIENMEVEISSSGSSFRFVYSNGTYSEWIEISNGKDGLNGINGRDGRGIKNMYELSLGKKHDIKVEYTDSQMVQTIATIWDGADGQDGQDGQNGQDGADGFSPILTETQTTEGYDIEITDATGTRTISLLNGKDGEGSGDMSASDYDSDNSVKSAGGIKAYVDVALGGVETLLAQL